MQLVIVNDGSVLNFGHTEFPGIEEVMVINRAENGGTAAALHDAAMAASGEYCIVLEDDRFALGALARLYHALKEAPDPVRTFAYGDVELPEGVHITPKWEPHNRQLANVEAGTAAGAGARLDRSGTDLEAALLASRGELAPEHVPRIVLFSDGHATAGDTKAAHVRLAGGRIPVATEPLASRSIGDTWIDSIDVPGRAAAGGTFAVGVQVGSQRDGIAVVEVRHEDRVLARRPVALQRGVTGVALEATIEAPGEYVLTAAVAIDGDPLGANNTLEKAVWVGQRARVLYVEGTPASARYLTGALTGSGFDVTVLAPPALPASAGALDPYDVVILSDVGRAAISNDTMTALSDWVERLGGGLLVAGGEAVFGEGGPGGYRKSPLERLTPVTFERRDEPEVALVIVLDRSWSMAGASMERSIMY
jgi:hypothetical protein